MHLCLHNIFKISGSVIENRILDWVQVGLVFLDLMEFLKALILYSKRKFHSIRDFLYINLSLCLWKQSKNTLKKTHMLAHLSKMSPNHYPTTKKSNSNKFLRTDDTSRGEEFTTFIHNLIEKELLLLLRSKSSKEWHNLRPLMKWSEPDLELLRPMR